MTTLLVTSGSQSAGEIVEVGMDEWMRGYVMRPSTLAVTSDPVFVDPIDNVLTRYVSAPRLQDLMQGLHQGLCPPPPYLCQPLQHFSLQYGHPRECNSCLLTLHLCNLCRNIRTSNLCLVTIR